MQHIDNVMRSPGQWKINECGFKPDHRTEDSLFIFRATHEEQSIKGQEIICHLVDFSKKIYTIKEISFFRNYKNMVLLVTYLRL